MQNAPFDIETKDLDAIVILALDCLLSCIELLPLIYILAASVTSPVPW